MFKDYKGFDTQKLSKVKIVKLLDMKKEYEGIYLLNRVYPFEIVLLNNNGRFLNLDAKDFTDTNGEFFPYARYSLETINVD